MVKVETSTGFICEVDENAFNDVRLLAALRKLRNGDGTAILDVAEFVLAEKDIERLYKHVEENGRVPLEKFGNELTDIIQASNSGKK